MKKKVWVYKNKLSGNYSYDDEKVANLVENWELEGFIEGEITPEVKTVRREMSFEDYGEFVRDPMYGWENRKLEKATNITISFDEPVEGKDETK